MGCPKTVSSEDYPPVAKAREIRERIETEYTGLSVYLTGVSMLNNAFAETGTADMSSLVPLMFAAILVLTFIIIRSVAATPCWARVSAW